MADERDIRAQKLARAEFIRHGIDIGRADIHVARGVLHIGGMIQIPGRIQKDQLKHDVELVARLLKMRPEFRDVVVEAVYTT